VAHRDRAAPKADTTATTSMADTPPSSSGVQRVEGSQRASDREIPVTRNTGDRVADAYADFVAELQSAWAQRSAIGAHDEHPRPHA
jgi:hypothetical protein